MVETTNQIFMDFDSWKRRVLCLINGFLPMEDSDYVEFYHWKIVLLLRFLST